MTISSSAPGGMAAVLFAVSGPLFSLGQVVATPGALDLLAKHGVEPAELLARHLSGDWGQLCADDTQANDEALTVGNRLLSSYALPQRPSGSPEQEGTMEDRVWIVTEHDRSSTCILLPSEY